MVKATKAQKEAIVKGMIDKRISDIRERISKTTAGQWVAGSQTQNQNPGDIFVIPAEDTFLDIGHMNRNGDARFVAEAKDDIKFLIDVIEGKAEQRVDEIEENIKEEQEQTE